MNRIKRITYILLFVLIISIPNVVFASFLYDGGLQCETVNTGVENCKLGFVVTDEPYVKNHVKVSLVLTNITESNFKVSDGWYLISQNEVRNSNEIVTYNFEFGAMEETQTIGFHEMATITLTKVPTALNCLKRYQGQLADVFSCQINDVAGQNVYYNQSGEVVDWRGYQKSCEKVSCQKVCEPGNDDNCIYFDNNKSEVADEKAMNVACGMKCSYKDSKYYNDKGEVVTWNDYQKACKQVSCQKVCEPNNDSNCMYFDNKNNQVADEKAMNVACGKKCAYKNGKYYNNEGEEVSWLDYEKSCNTYSCQKVCEPNNNSNCVYYNNNNEVVADEKAMNVACGKTCTYKNGKYYNKAGEEVSWQAYDLDCNNYTCRKVCNPNNNNDCIYYGSSGENVGSEDAMKKSCGIEEQHICEIVEDKYYNSKNTEVSWKEYTLDCFPTKCQKVCNPKKGDECLYLDNSGKETTEIKYLQECETHICEQVGDLYYDINGDVVTKEAMDKSCADAIVCDYKDGNYYDENGNITTKENYELKCLKHTCKKIGDTYFDKDGNVVDADTYDKSCNPKIENPKTGWTIPLLSLFLLLGIGLVVYREIKKHSKFM